MAITTDIRDRLVALERTITVNGETVNASEYISLGIQDFDLPVFVNFPLAATRVRTADTFYAITRNWALVAWGSPAPTVIRPDQTEEWMYDLIDAVYAFFLPRPRLELSGAAMNFVQQAILTGDSGIQVRTYPEGSTGDPYHTVTFNMAVSYRSDCVS